ncbi:MAG: membrane-bound O-acyltransferase family protein, partial [Synergistaceae bacterium]|nr:membrane-bound O-acyltransferase family protein [Synergistaceae bacterium]
MVFSSGVFLFAFLPCLLILYYCVKALSVRNYILLAASLLFYAWGEPLFIFIMSAAIVINWLIALLMTSHKKLWLIIA